MMSAQALEYIRRVRPDKAYLVGMTHEFDYHVQRERIAATMAREGLDVEMGYDGLAFELDV